MSQSSFHNLIFLGPPGCGKGSQAEFCVNTYGYIHFSTGDMLRQEEANKTELGLKIQKVMSTGALICDDLMIQLVHGAIQSVSLKKKFILDGFPRTLEQARALDKLLLEMGLSNLRVFEFKMEVSDLLERVVGRLSCFECGKIYHEVSKPPIHEGFCDKCKDSVLVRRKDDNKNVLERRIQDYISETQPLVKYYEEKGVLVILDAKRPMLEISNLIKNHMYD